MPNDPVAWYDAHAPALAVTYEAIEAARLHAWLDGLLPGANASALDVGAGTGRDAAWLASRGFEVVAVEPSVAMREQALALHATSSVRWVSDSLPDLRHVLRMGLSFDVILLSAVWMHVPTGERARAFRKLITLLKPGGLLAITLRLGPAAADRAMHPVSEAEVEQLARAHGAFVERRVSASDQQGRNDVSWIQMAIRLPDDGTGALPLLRHVILNDDKSSTYKLALLRSLGRIADGAAGYARITGDDEVAVPLGLVGLYWIRLFKPLLAADLPQNPRNRGLEQLGFVRDGFRRLAGVTHLDLRVGLRFSADRAAALHAALRDACRTIESMPAHYLTYPGGGPVFAATCRSPGRAPDSVTLDEPYLTSFGDLRMPLHLWKTLQRFDAWIEPAVIAEWIRLMKTYALKQERSISEPRAALALAWADEGRDVRVPRELAVRAMASAPLFCVWSGRRLTDANLDVDHCFPWAGWPCDHLWNLMPAHREVNQRQKRDRLPSDPLLRGARDRIIEWWDRAYARGAEPIQLRFRTEAQAGLPAMTPDAFRLDDVFAGLMVQRMRLKMDQGIPEWFPGGTASSAGNTG